MELIACPAAAVMSGHPPERCSHRTPGTASADRTSHDRLRPGHLRAVRLASHTESYLTPCKAPKRFQGPSARYGSGRSMHIGCWIWQVTWDEPQKHCGRAAGLTPRRTASPLCAWRPGFALGRNTATTWLRPRTPTLLGRE